jgi:hypothetical protein
MELGTYDNVAQNSITFQQTMLNFGGSKLTTQVMTNLNPHNLLIKSKLQSPLSKSKCHDGRCCNT